MSKIKNMQDLREHAIQTLEALQNGEIDTAQAGVTGKLCEGVIATVKAQLEYARMLQQTPEIPFMQNCHKVNTHLIEHEGSPQLLSSPKRRIENQ